MAKDRKASGSAGMILIIFRRDFGPRGEKWWGGLERGQAANHCGARY